MGWRQRGVTIQVTASFVVPVFDTNPAVTQVKVYYSTTSGVDTQDLSVTVDKEGPTTNVVVDNLVSGQTYYVRAAVIAVPGGESALSAEITRVAA